jgi:DNA-binding GntR family transcriptional regulator/predicted DNA-binding transcriptional regulator AlpA
MPVTLNQETYYTATEAIEYLGISRPTFYQNVRPQLQQYKLGVTRTTYYAKGELDTFKGIRPVLEVTGIQPTFEGYLQNQGREPMLEDIEPPALVPASQQLAGIFNIAPGSPIVHRIRKQGDTQQGFYRIAENYYPVDLAGNDILKAMQEDVKTDVLALIQAQHGTAIRYIHEEVKGRHPNMKEQRILGITAFTPVQEIHRTCYASAEKEQVVMYNEIIVEAGYVTLKYDYPVEHWG